MIEECGNIVSFHGHFNKDKLALLTILLEYGLAKWNGETWVPVDEEPSPVYVEYMVSLGGRAFFHIYDENHNLVKSAGSVAEMNEIAGGLFHKGMSPEKPS